MAARPAVFILSAFWASVLSAAPYDWLQLNGDSHHSGNNTREKAVGASNVANLSQLFRATLPSIADGAPVYLSGVATPSGTRDLLFVTTKAGHIIALDAHTGAQIWSHQYPAGSCLINGGSTPCYTTSSPAIDPNRLYVYSYGLDGKVHKFQVGDGTETVTGGWPETATLKAFNEKGSSALSFATAASGTTYLYVANGGYPGDAGDYQGHVTAINLADGSQKVFNTLCSDQAVHFVETPGTPDCAHVQSAIWARVGVVYDSVTDRIYMATGNGTYDANAGGHEWGDSVIALSPDATGSGGKPLDSYTPTNYQNLQDTDADLGSTAPAILPASGFAGRLAVQAGKDAKLRLLDLTNLSGHAAPGFTGGELQVLPVPQGCQVLTAPAVWIDPSDGSTWFFVINACGTAGIKLTFPGGAPTLVPQWQSGISGFSPLVANDVLYMAGGGSVRALDPRTGAQLWSGAIGGTHWESPIVANATLYVTDESSHLTAFSLGPYFQDVASGDFAYRQIEGIARAGIAAGCSTTPPLFCPGSPVTRAQTAVFIERGKRGSTFNPSCTTQIFNDVACSSFAAGFINALAADGITAGCGSGNFCPGLAVSRAQMAVFIERGVHGSAFSPPCTGQIFNDVPCSSFAAGFINALAADGITAGCGGGNFCPGLAVSRAQMAVFIVTAFSIPH